MLWRRVCLHPSIVQHTRAGGVHVDINVTCTTSQFISVADSRSDLRALSGTGDRPDRCCPEDPEGAEEGSPCHPPKPAFPVPAMETLGMETVINRGFPKALLN